MRQLRQIHLPPQAPLAPQCVTRPLGVALERHPFPVGVEDHPRHPAHMPEREMQVCVLGPPAILLLPDRRLRRAGSHPRTDAQRHGGGQPSLEHPPAPDGGRDQLLQIRQSLVVQVRPDRLRLNANSVHRSVPP